MFETSVKIRFIQGQFRFARSAFGGQKIREADSIILTRLLRAQLISQSIYIELL